MQYNWFPSQFLLSFVWVVDAGHLYWLFSVVVKNSSIFQFNFSLVVTKVFLYKTVL